MEVIRIPATFLVIRQLQAKNRKAKTTLCMNIARNFRRLRGLLALALNLALDPVITFGCCLPRCVSP
jgi:hypothetical protein